MTRKTQGFAAPQNFPTSSKSGPSAKKSGPKVAPPRTPVKHGLESIGVPHDVADPVCKWPLPEAMARKGIAARKHGPPPLSKLAPCSEKWSRGTLWWPPLGDGVSTRKTQLRAGLVTTNRPNCIRCGFWAFSKTWGRRCDLDLSHFVASMATELCGEPCSRSHHRDTPFSKADCILYTLGQAVALRNRISSIWGCAIVYHQTWRAIWLQTGMAVRNKFEHIFSMTKKYRKQKPHGRVNPTE